MCAWSCPSAKTARARPEAESVPTSSSAGSPHGAGPSSSQSPWISSPGGCAISIVTRPFTPVQAAHGGRRPRFRSARVKDG